MTHITDLRALYEYSCWMNDRILDAASRVSPQQFVAPTDLTPRSLRENLVHILDVEWSWRERARGAPREVWIVEMEVSDFQDVAAIKSRWEEESAVMREYLAGLSGADLEVLAPLGGDRQVSLGDVLRHAIMHGVLARVEAAVLLTSYGQSPGDLDYLDYVGSRG